MNAKADPHKEARIAEICEVYASCSDNAEEITFSVDEMTGIQALERIASDLALAPGKPLAREFEYKRHGTQTLIAALRVAMGSVYAHCGETRTEEDFCRFIAALIEHHPGYLKWTPCPGQFLPEFKRARLLQSQRFGAAPS